MALAVGDRVMITGKEGAGTVVRVDGRKVLVKLDNLGFPISVDVDLVQLKQGTEAPSTATSKIESVTVKKTAAEEKVETTAATVSRTEAPPASDGALVRTAAKGPLSANAVLQQELKPKVKSNDSPERISLLRDIESLRYGVVPYGSIEDLTVGFADIEKWVKSRMPENLGHRSVSEVIGPFGTGKSHSMSLIRHIARKRNYLTARVEIDGGEVTLANPEGLLRALWPSLSGSDFSVSTPIVELCLRAIDKGEDAPRIKAKIERAYDNFKTVEKLSKFNRIDEVAEELDGVMSCSGEFTYREVQTKINREILHSAECFVRPPLTTVVSEKPSQFLECLISYALIAERAGYSGLIITIDEFEIEDKQTQANKNRIVDLVMKLIDYFGDLEGYVSSPLAIFFASVKEEDTIGNRLIAEIAGTDENARYMLQELSKDHILMLSKLIFEKYKQAYSLSAGFSIELAEKILRHVEVTSIEGLSVVREFIKTWIYTLDGVYGPGVSSR